MYGDHQCFLCLHTFWIDLQAWEKNLAAETQGKQSINEIRTYACKIDYYNHSFDQLFLSCYTGMY